MADLPGIMSLNDEETIYLFCLINPKGLDINPLTDYNQTGVRYTLVNFFYYNIYFTNHVGVRYGTRDYLPIPCTISDLSYTANAEASPTITIGDSKGIVGSILDTNRGIEGCEVSVQRIKRRCLDDGATPNYSYRTPPEIFRIGNLTSRTSKIISYKLKPRVTLKSQIPGRSLVEFCNWRQYRGDGCEYYGTAMFTADNQPTNDPNQDICGRSRKSCNLRGNFANYGGCPSIDTI